MSRRLGPRDWLAVALIVPSFLVLVIGVTLAIARGRVAEEQEAARRARIRADLTELAERVRGALAETPTAASVAALGVAVPVDPWGRAYVVELEAADGAGVRVRTLGADGVPGGRGADQDVDDRMVASRDY